MKKTIASLTFVLWLTVILTVFYIVQKPDFLSVLSGLKQLSLNLLVPILMFLWGACVGGYFLSKDEPIERLIFGAAIGMILVGYLGFGLAVSGLATPVILSIVLILPYAFFLFNGDLARAWRDIKSVVGEIRASARNVPSWIPFSAGIAFSLAVLMGLAPPIEDFDALLYHLTAPAWWLRDGSLIHTQSLATGYWMPHIVEGSFVFPMTFGVDSATHLIHLLWLCLSALLLLHWARRVWDDAIAWNAIAILLTMPSLLWLASWAYTDYALTFAGMAVIYSLWKWRCDGNARWIITSGIMAGLAMGIKYQSFVIPLTGVTLITIWGQGVIKRIKEISYFSLVALVVACPWYMRNWIWMGNPFYPFAFGGRFWDSFLSQWVSRPGTGIGFDIGKLLLLPITATLGIQDANFFDGRFGPFFLVLFPVSLYVYWKTRHKGDEQATALSAIYLLSLMGITAWTIGVMNTSSLLQNRYLFPSLIPLTIPLSLGMIALYKLDFPRLRISFVFRAMLAFAIFINLFDFSLHTLLRNPLAVAMKMVSREKYMESRQPGYTNALKIINQLPTESKVYFLFEPRSYGAEIWVEPDGSNAHFPHDIWLYGTPEKIIAAWKELGYTHVLLSRTGADFVYKNIVPTAPNESAALDQTVSLLIRIDSTEGEDYILYKIP